MRLYYCYSYPQKEFLKERGVLYISTSVHPTTNKRYWLFEGTEKLNFLLQEWRDNK